MKRYDLLGVLWACDLERIGNNLTPGIETATRGDLAAILAPASMLGVPARAAAHHRCIASLMRAVDFLPATLGVGAARSDAEALLTWRAIELRGALETFGRAGAFGVRVASAERQSVDDAHDTVEPTTTQAPPGAPRANRLRRLQAAAALKRRAVEALDVLLATVADAPGVFSTRRAPGALEAPARGEVLVAGRGVACVGASLHAARRETLDCTLAIDVSGPWPPYGAFDFRAALVAASGPAAALVWKMFMSHNDLLSVLDLDGSSEAVAEAFRDGVASGRLPHEIRLDPEHVERDLVRLVLTLVEFIRQLLEAQAVRRMENGSLTEEEEERLGETLMKAREKILELAESFGLDARALTLDLGPLGRLV